ncbi:MAG: AI-2E family transporter [Aureliella sp.]
MSRLISFAVLIAIIIIIGLLFYKVLIGFFIPVFLAAVLVVVFRPLHRWVLEKTGHRDQIAAAITTGLIMLCLFLPIVLVLGAAGAQGLALTEKNNQGVFNIRYKTILTRLGLEMPEYIDELRSAEKQIQNIIDKSENASLSQEDPILIELGKKAKESIIRLRDRVQPARAENEPPETSADSMPAAFESDSAAVLTEVGTESEESVEEAAPVPVDPFDRLLLLCDKVGRVVTDDEDLLHPPAIDMRSQFVDLKTKLLGGTFWAFARETANPTEVVQKTWTNNIMEYVRPRLLAITGATGSFLIKVIFGSIIMIVATFFFLYDGPAMLKTVMRLSPLDDAYEQELLLEFDRISRAVVVATLLSAVVQGLTAGLGYAVAGMDFLVLLIMLTTVFAMVPFVGPAVIWVPVCLYIGIYEGRYTAAILLACWGVLVVGTIDNFVKALVLHGQSQLHPLLALLSVLGGVQTLGPIGIVVGPMVVAMLQTLLSILQRELMHFDKQNLVLATQGLTPGSEPLSTTGKKVSKRKSKIREKASPKENPSSNQDAGAANVASTDENSEDDDA